MLILSLVWTSSSHRAPWVTFTYTDLRQMAHSSSAGRIFETTLGGYKDLT